MFSYTVPGGRPGAAEENFDKSSSVFSAKDFIRASNSGLKWRINP
jgi:hypothetical protein